ncbi:VCBS domain-containing protein, partial [Photobacterium lipolyticum]
AVFAPQSKVAGEHGTFSIDAEGNWTYELDNNDPAVQALKEGEMLPAETFEVKSADGSASHPITVTITGTNDGITAQADSGATDQNTVLDVTASHGVLSNDTDLDGDSLIVSEINGDATQVGNAVTLASGAIVTLNANGSYSYDANGQFDSLKQGEKGTDSFTYTVTDGKGETATETVTITITGTNDAPTLAAGSISASEDALENGINVDAATSNLLDKAHDVDDADGTLAIGTVNGNAANVGEAVTVTLNYTDADDQAQTQDVSLTVNADGSYSIAGFDLDALPAGSNATASFSYQVKDDQGELSNSDTATITITGTNDAPVIHHPEMGSDTWVHDTYAEGSGKQNVFSEVSVSDVDSANLSRAVISLTSPTEKDGELQNGYDPAHDSLTLPAELADQFVLTYRDYPDAKGNPTAYWTLEIKDGGTLPKAEFEAALKALQYENTADEPVGINAAKSFGLDVFDDQGASSNRLSLELKLQNINEAPEFRSPGNDDHGLDAQGQADADSYSFTVKENDAGAKIGQVASFDPDAGDKPTYSLTNHTELFEINPNTGEISLKEGVALDYETKNSYELNIEVSDQDGLKDTATVEVKVDDVNEAPDAVDDKGIESEPVILDGSNWDTSADIKVDYYVIDVKTGVKVADAQKVEFTGDGNTEFGVHSDLIDGKGSDPENIWVAQMAHADGKSEAMCFSFENNQLSNHVDVSIGNLWGNGWELEQGVWKAYYQGSLVATDVFKRADLAPSESGYTDYHRLGIDTGNRYFDRVEFSAIEYGEGTKGADSSDYFITKVEANLTTFDQAFQAGEGDKLIIDVLSNDTDPDTGDKISIVPGSFPSEFVSLNDDGKLEFDAAKYLQTLAADERDLQVGEVRNVEFEYTIQDEAGLPDTAKVTVTVIGENTLPEFISDTDNDAGMGSDGTPTDDSYQFSVAEHESGASIGMVAAHDADSDSGLSYQLIDESNLFQVDGSTGEISLKAGAQLDYETQTEHKLQVKVTDSEGGSDLADVTVAVTDMNEAPRVAPLHGYGDIEPSPVNKVTIIFDNSASMGNDFSGKRIYEDENGRFSWDEFWSSDRWPQTRMYNAVQAIKTMLDGIEEQGGDSTYIHLVTFNSDAKSEGWFTVDSLQEWLSNNNNLIPGGSTDYSLALQKAMDNYDSGDLNSGVPADLHQLDGENTIYFFSDGDSDVQEQVITDWKAFTQQQDAKVCAVGIATEGNDKAEAALGSVSSEVVYVNNGEDLAHYLDENKPNPINGHLLQGVSDPNGDLALSVVVDSIDDINLLKAELSEDINATENVLLGKTVIDGSLQIDTVFGNLIIEANGDYSFNPGSNPQVQLTDGQQVDLKFQYQIEDGKGGVSDNVFTLTLTGGIGSDSKPIELEQNAQAGDELANILSGTDRADILLGQGGEDTLDGGAGNDILVGGSGNDILSGGLGDDILTGGEGSDVFTWHTSSLSDVVQQDVITDFQLGEDKLDLIEILPGIKDDNPDMDALLDHLKADVTDDGKVNLTITADSGQQNIVLDNVDLSGLNLESEASSRDIVDQLFQHQAFKTDL